MIYFLSEEYMSNWEEHQEMKMVFLYEQAH